MDAARNDKFAIWWDGAEKILRVQFLGDQTDEDATEYVTSLNKIVRELWDKGESTQSVIIDLSQAGNPSMKARVKYGTVTDELAANIKDGKIAYIGASAVNKLIARFVHSFTSSPINVNFFNTVDEAKRWLGK